MNDLSAPPRRHRLSGLFAPRSVALVGASEKSMWSHLIHRNYADYGYDGALYAVNRGGASAHGLPGYSTCAAIGTPVDAAYLFVPQAAMVEALEDAAAAGIRNAVILTSGYAEAGPAGVEAQRVLLARADELGVAVWGPNSLGFVNIAENTPMSSIPVVRPLMPGPVAIVSQSGATASELYEFAHSQNIGCSFIAATGNEGRLTIVDVIDYLIEQDHTRVIAVFTEMIRDPQGFVRVGERARLAGKAIVILKVGRSELSGAIAMAHTGSLVGDDQVFDAVCARAGVIRVDTAEDLITTAGLISATGPLKAQGLSFVSISGGACTLVADAAEASGVDLPSSTDETARRLAEVMPEFGSSLNPLDITGAAIRDTSLFERVIPIAAANPGVGLVAVCMTIPTTPGQGIPGALEAIGRGIAAIDQPGVVVSTCGKALNEVSREAARTAGLPHLVTSIDRFIKATGKAFWWSQAVTRPGSAEANVADRRARPTSERETLDYLASHGVPVIPGDVATTPAKAAAIAAREPGPFALKIVSPDIAHKTEVGGVRLGIPAEHVEDVAADILETVARNAPTAAIIGVMVSPMRTGGLELLVGVTRDPEWGPMITVGFGGVLVELLADARLAPLPVTRTEVIEMLRGLRGAKLLGGYRGGAPSDLDAIADAVVTIGDAALALGPTLAALEINPLFVSGDKVEALDALVLWDGGAS